LQGFAGIFCSTINIRYEISYFYLHTLRTRFLICSLLFFDANFEISLSTNILRKFHLTLMMASAKLSTKSKAAPKTTQNAAVPTARASRKRKPEEDESKPASPPAKKPRPAAKTATESTTVTRTKATPRLKAVAKRTVAKPKVVINSVPTQILDVYVFGEGSSSELGLGTAKTAIDVKRPRLNPLLSSKDVGVVHVACGGMHVAVLTHDNKVLTWGVNDQGALGRHTSWEGGMKDMDDNASDDSEKSDSGLNPLESSPTAVPASSFPEGTRFVKLSAGDSHTLALTDEGLVYGWGCFRVSTQNFHSKTLWGVSDPRS
jgi:regulator of chromosome condensation